MTDNPEFIAEQGDNAPHLFQSKSKGIKEVVSKPEFLDESVHRAKLAAMYTEDAEEVLGKIEDDSPFA